MRVRRVEAASCRNNRGRGEETGAGVGDRRRPEETGGGVGDRRRPEETRLSRQPRLVNWNPNALLA
jgi:hypothetical protein